MMAETREGTPVVGEFDDEGAAQRGVQRLRDVGFDANALRITRGEVVGETVDDESPVPSSLSAPYAFIAALLAGAVCGVVAGIIGPPTVTAPGFGWVINTVLLLSLTGGLLGWVLGGILGYGAVSSEEQDDIPEDAVAPRVATTVSIRAPGRSEEARIVLRSAGAYAVRGGDVGRQDDPALQRLQPRPGGRSYGRGSLTARPLPRGANRTPESRPGLLSRIFGRNKNR